MGNTMPAASGHITDVLALAAPTAATNAAALNAGIDYAGEESALIAALVQARTSANNLINSTDGADPNKAVLTALRDALYKPAS